MFASSHGDQSITDYMCATLAQAPTELSPIRFHNSVHNAAVGYWTIATGCHAPSTAVCAQRASFGAGLLEAASQVLAEQRPVLLVCSDIAGSGPLARGHRLPPAVRLRAGAGAASRCRRRLARLDLQLTAAATDTPLAEPLAGWRDGNPSAAGAAAAGPAGRRGRCTANWPAAATLGLRIDMEHVT